MKVCRCHHLDAAFSNGYVTFGDYPGLNVGFVAEQIVRRSGYLPEPTIRETDLPRLIQEPNRIGTVVEVRGLHSL